MNRLSEPNLGPSRGFETPTAVENTLGQRTGLDRLFVRHVRKSPAPTTLSLTAVVLLAGSVGPSAFRSALDRAVVDLPLDQGRTVLSQWGDQCGVLARSVGSEDLSVRVLVDHKAQLPKAPGQSGTPIRFSVERDPSELRGTGGLLRDVAESYGDHDWLIVANAIQLLRTPLPVLAAELAAQCAPVVVVSHADGTPSGMMLVQCGCLREIPRVGYVDMKEQGLAIMARHHTVRVLEKAEPTGYPIRTYVNYLAALRRYHARAASSQPEDWESCFAVVEQGADVAQGASVHDSVVLRGGRVERGAVVINSLVCSGGVVSKGQTVTDDLVCAARRRG